jgi:DNA invertase Pin-like site-specific DNA recombinase
MNVIGYARVSAHDQHLDNQLAALRTAGATKVFSEKESGTKTDRKELAKAIGALQEGDVLLVCKIDRLARSTRDFLNTLDTVAQAGAGFKSLGEPAIDTTSASPYAKLLVTVLAAFAELERTMILNRCAEGRKRARANGTVFGRKHSLTRFQQIEALRRRERGERLRDIAKSYGVSHSTISRLGGSSDECL